VIGTVGGAGAVPSNFGGRASRFVPSIFGGPDGAAGGENEPITREVIALDAVPSR
jgi:hypothetical protein